MDLRIRIPNTDLSFYIQRLYRLLDVGDPHIKLYIQTRISENENFIEDCYLEECYIINYAVKIGNIDTVSALLEIPEIHRYLEKKDETGRTPLEWSCHKKDIQMSLLLVSSGANIELQNIRTMLWDAI